MPNRAKTAFAALAILGVALPGSAAAQTPEAAEQAHSSAGAEAAEPLAQTVARAEAAEPIAPTDAGDEVAEPLAQTDAGAEVAEPLAQTDAGAEAAEPLAQADAGDEAVGPTWEAVTQLVEEALPEAPVAPMGGAAEASEAPTQADTATNTGIGGAEPDWEAILELVEGATLRVAQTRETGNAAKSLAFADTAEPASEAARDVAEWVIASGDNGDLPFIVIDKIAAQLVVFAPEGGFQGVAPVLLGIASGDEATPGVGERQLSEIGPAERTTPAGRYRARYGYAFGGVRVLWVDYATSVALHPVITTNRRERRLQRLTSPSPDDNRITFGCINVPIPFYRDVIRPLFRRTGGIVYILPETMPVEEAIPRMRDRSRSRAMISH